MNMVVLITAKDSAEGDSIVKKLVEDRLIACGNIVPGIKSLFWWEGKVDTADEVLLVLKTNKKYFPEIEKTVKSLHSYDVPEIIALPIVEGSPEYLKWIEESVR